MPLSKQERDDAGRGFGLSPGGAVCGLGVVSGCAGGGGQLLRAGYAAVLAARDADGDGALDRGEVTAMVERAFPPEQRAGPGWEALRGWLVAGYMAQDRDGDGRLTLDELAQAGACAEPGRRVSAAEIAASIGRCPAGMLPLPEGLEGTRPGDAAAES